MIRSLIFAVPIAFAATASPAFAQDENTKVNLVYITEDEDCPESSDDTITVCGVLEEQFRIPRALRHSDNPENTAWSERVSEFRTAGDSGINSCTPVGPGGSTGCTQQLIEAAYKDKANSPEVRFGQVIAEARAERMSTIDADAAEQQARVEQIEREYEERLERERQGPTADEVEETAPPALIAPGEPRVSQEPG